MWAIRVVKTGSLLWKSSDENHIYIECEELNNKYGKKTYEIVKIS